MSTTTQFVPNQAQLQLLRQRQFLQQAAMRNGQPNGQVGQPQMAPQFMQGLGGNASMPNGQPLPQGIQQPQQLQQTPQLSNIPSSVPSPVVTNAARASSVPVNLAVPNGAQTTPAIPGAAVYRLVQYGEHLSPMSEASKFDIEHWRKFTSEFYAESGLMKYSVRNSQFKDVRVFELNTSLLPRFYLINFESGVTEMNLTLENPQEYVLPNESHVVECTRANFIYHFDNDVQVTVSGILRVAFNAQLKIELMEFHSSHHNEYLSRSFLLSLAQQASDAKDASGKPKMKASNSDDDLIDLPPSCVNEYGVPIKTMRCLEISEVIFHMRDLISYSLEFNTGAIQSLQKYAEALRNVQNRIVGINGNFNAPNGKPSPGPQNSSNEMNESGGSIVIKQEGSPAPHAESLHMNEESPVLGKKESNN
ncbi:hypothetical protein K7432_003508 [Basidiobolus ranarum]|uniref:Uncharacterized protein n=1 Tax=Basidiobolus ranarum TaxID=34480 RepID=A0ABR2WZN9_9FUNG